MFTKIVTTFCFIFSLSSFAEVTITVVNKSNDELKIKRMLESLQNSYNLTSWIYTDKIQVDSNAKTPSSHPVLTMSTQNEYLNSNIKLLSSFLHEQFHWHVIRNGKGTKSEFRESIKAEFPNVQFERPPGSGTQGGTLSHIIVCYLEYVALTELVGKEKAAQTLSTNDYYTWVYQTILDPANHDKLERLISRFGLQIGVKNS